MVTEGPAKEKLLNDNFTSVFTHDDGNRPRSTGECHMMLAWIILKSHQLKS